MKKSKLTQSPMRNGKIRKPSPSSAERMIQKIKNPNIQMKNDAFNKFE